MNAYRTLARGASPHEAVSRTKRLVSCERSIGIVALGSHGVLAELLCHVADQTDPDFDICTAAICAFVTHVSQSGDGRSKLRLVPQPEAQLCEPIFGRSPKELESISRTLRTAAYLVFAAPDRESLAENTEGFTTISNTASQLEDVYVDVMRKSVSGPDLSAPGARAALRTMLVGEEGRRMAASVLVQRASVVLRATIPDDIAEYSIEYFLDAFPAAIDFAVHRLQRLLDGASPERDANSYWDGEFAFLLGQTCSMLDGQGFTPAVPITLITSDGALRRTASRCGLEHRCVGWAKHARDTTYHQAKDA